MGQHCSVLTCRHVEHPDGLTEMSRVDSPDPVMYDLMRKSIQATTALEQGGNVKEMSCNPPETAKAGKHSRRKPVGQSHLLYRNSPKSSEKSAGKKSQSQEKKKSDDSSKKQKSNQRAMESRGGGKVGSNPAAASNSSSNSSSGSIDHETISSWDAATSDSQKASPQTLKCPTRLLIRRRSLRVTEEGGGTHIYAIRYPEDTSNMILSEQAQPLSPIVRQEQCPPRSHKVSNTATGPTDRVSSISNNSTPTSTNNQKDDDDPKSAKKTEPQAATVSSSSDDNTKKTKTKRKSKKDSSKSKDDATTKSKSSTDPSSLLPNATVLPENAGEIFSVPCMAALPKRNVLEWVTVSEEHNIYVADVGLTGEQSDEVVATTEQVCRGQYAAYTYAKQTLGCREFPLLAHASHGPVHTIVHSIINKFPLEETKDGGDAAKATTTTSSATPKSNDKAKNKSSSSADDNNKSVKRDLSASKSEEGVEQPQRQLQLDDREPHIVKYDVTRKERQKLDMHTDKSEWTFLIALSNGCGVDYEGGGTYFECIDATVHIQRGHALVFPGKLRHCGQKITSGLRFLLVGFLVDKQSTTAPGAPGKNTTPTTTATTGGKSPAKKDPKPASSPTSTTKVAKDPVIVSVQSC